jgi:hypothetical protein
VTRAGIGMGYNVSSCAEDGASESCGLRFDAPGASLKLIQTAW